MTRAVAVITHATSPEFTCWHYRHFSIPFRQLFTCLFLTCTAIAHLYLKYAQMQHILTIQYTIVHVNPLATHLHPNSLTNKPIFRKMSEKTLHNCKFTSAWKIGKPPLSCTNLQFQIKTMEKTKAAIKG